MTKARADVHHFAPAAVDKAVAEGLAVARASREAAVRVRSEREFRRSGLFASLGVILLAIVALAVKIRDLDHRGPP